MADGLCYAVVAEEFEKLGVLEIDVNELRAGLGQAGSKWAMDLPGSSLNGEKYLMVL